MLSSTINNCYLSQQKIIIPKRSRIGERTKISFSLGFSYLLETKNKKMGQSN